LRKRSVLKEHIDILRRHASIQVFPATAERKWSPSVYLTEVPATLAEVLIGLIGQEVAPIARSAAQAKPVSTDDLDSWERKIEQGVAADPSIPETERLAIIRARKGQGLFKERVAKIESKCRITGVENPVHLVASHCKPWRDATNEERLNGENGLLLTASIISLTAALSGLKTTEASSFRRSHIVHHFNEWVLIRQPLSMSVYSPMAKKQFLDFHREAVLFQSNRG
jgi:putative restriction endonuclease